MAPANRSDQSIQLRRDDSDEQYISDEEEYQSSAAESEEESVLQPDGLNAGDEGKVGNTINNVGDDASQTESSDERPDDFRDISFGALAKAQASLVPPSRSRKRKTPASEITPADYTSTLTSDNPHPTREVLSKRPKQDLEGRSSKHAPAVLSSRNPVSRKRIIFSPPPVAKSRDPRFDPTITSRTLNTNAISNADKAYSFLTDYQATEILQLKAEIKKSQTSNPTHADELKKKVMSMEARVRNAATKSKEREILKRHKDQEKEAIREGKKNRPFFLKKSALKQEVERARVEGMGKKQRDKMEKRKRKREKTKDARDMPWARRMG